MSRREVETARSFAEQSLSSATKARMLEYIGMAKGNLAWVHLRRGDITDAYEHGYEGVEKLRQTSQGHILLWVALWPLIGVAIAREQTADAIDHVEKLLIPPQMAIPAALETELRAAVDAWNLNDSAEAKLSLEERG